MKLIFCLLFSINISAQELFVFTEPASNMPANSVGLRLMNSFMFEKTGKLNFHNMPELMWGVNKKLMLHGQFFLSTRENGDLKNEGAAIYTKYRFLSNDDLHSHFRMAAFGRLSYNNSILHQEEIETMGQNSGYEMGVIATRLLKKVALNSTISIEKDLSYKSHNPLPISNGNSALNYTLGFGKLMLPKVYKNYHQTNFNVMVEFLGQYLTNSKKSFLDIAPSVQFIINSQARIDLGYRKQLYTQMSRTSPNVFIIKLEYTFFNVLKNNN